MCGLGAGVWGLLQLRVTALGFRVNTRTDMTKSTTLGASPLGGGAPPKKLLQSCYCPTTWHTACMTSREGLACFCGPPPPPYLVDSLRDQQVRAGLLLQPPFPPIPGRQPA